MEPDILASDDSETEEVHKLTINEHYAKAFEYRKEREELQRLKDKYGSDVDEDEDEEEDSEEAESEDEDGEELTPAVDAAILRTLARIKRKDPSIYQADNDVFEEEVKKTGKAKIISRGLKDKSKPLTIKQQNLEAALRPDSRSPSPEPMTHVKEQKALRSETIAAFHTAVKDADSEDDLLVPREKTKDELEREEEEYQEYLKREVGTDLKELITLDEEMSAFIADVEMEESKESKKAKKEKKVKKEKSVKREEDQEFLMNYILGRGWIDRSTKRLPTYKEITESKSKVDKGKARADTPKNVDEETSDQQQFESEADGEGMNKDLDDDEFDEVADRFESSYNFRFEEPGADQIPRYPRTLASTVRREESSRKAERERRKTRKEEELLKKREEVKRLKALKMKEIRSKLERIGEEGGKKLDETEGLQKLDLDSDWDPDKHYKQMSKLYGLDDDGDIDGEKPAWDNDIDITDIVPEDSSSKKKKKKKKKKDEPEVEDGVDIGEMDADVVRDDEEWDGTEEMRKRKLDEYMDELYELEFNDVVAGMPTRFKYAKVQSQAFALSPVEILLATDAELNQYMGLKKLAPYRKDGGAWDKNRAARLKELKETILQRDAALAASGDFAKILPEMPAKKRKGKKERMREKATAVLNVNLEEGAEEQRQEKQEGGNKRKAADEKLAYDETTGTTDESLSKRKRRRRHKKTVQESRDA
ncbi:uncharacterized protein PHACADRAFT_186206 [Phanerochaete carnosa HHB-10118-sp]|uniref:Kri1-like C-terminal domain-containing protein n=1 Tax=Phanerochaete carnosa (strain HHB-10118-sp) TaxID=650164 RepID=K5W356_PHACS|nr:uncharacterized protein PHACADRAFT_186206 [Phanerochaete carnosa HHB-10118-sp]EKM53575.1 hypothetical protein PHACADRAFT_186206 [Phanerochaete carnosa HHB-10118-sp]